ncbi:hypothetical protein [Georgenia sp. SUBG003]|uniref:hypothetical protein n=1 Tax=Georgenia sp. SUBG003 TaxID=1497974 RepID=UPI003AB7A3B9
MDGGRVEDGRWVVEFTVRAQNRESGWAFEPRLTLVGLDGTHVAVDWEGELELLDGDGELHGDTVVIRTKPRSRVLKARLRGVSESALPVPATEAAVDVVLRHLGAALEEATA